jgi:hypothetical protein
VSWDLDWEMKVTFSYRCERNDGSGLKLGDVGFWNLEGEGKCFGVCGLACGLQFARSKGSGFTCAVYMLSLIAGPC